MRQDWRPDYGVFGYATSASGGPSSSWMRSAWRYSVVSSSDAVPLHTGKSTVVIEVKIERRREGCEPRLAANLIVSQFVLPPRD